MTSEIPRALTTICIYALLVDASMVDMIDGMRFFRFDVTTTFPFPPATTVGDPLPEVTQVSVAYTAK